MQEEIQEEMQKEMIASFSETMEMDAAAENDCCCRSKTSDTEAEDAKESIDDTCCSSHKSKHRSEEEARCLVNRLKRIEGQIRGIRGMVESGRYCTDILMQCAAAQAALNAFNRELLTEHIRTCVVDNIRSGSPEEAAEVVEELVSAMQKLMK